MCARASWNYRSRRLERRQAIKHFQRHPVISVSFEDVKADTLAAVIAGIREQIIKAYKEHLYLLDEERLDSTKARQFRLIFDNEVTDSPTIVRQSRESTLLLFGLFGTTLTCASYRP
jgi:hypothetical protein